MGRREKIAAELQRRAEAAKVDACESAVDWIIKLQNALQRCYDGDPVIVDRAIGELGADYSFDSDYGLPQGSPFYRNV